MKAFLTIEFQQKLNCNTTDLHDGQRDPEFNGLHFRLKVPENVSRLVKRTDVPVATAVIGVVPHFFFFGLSDRQLWKLCDTVGHKK